MCSFAQIDLNSLKNLLESANKEINKAKKKGGSNYRRSSLHESNKQNVSSVEGMIEQLIVIDEMDAETYMGSNSDMKPAQDLRLKLLETELFKVFCTTVSN